MVIAEGTMPLFQVAVADKDGAMWVFFKVESGLFQDYVFMLSDLDSNDHFNWNYAKLEQQQGAELECLPPTRESAELAVAFAQYFRQHRQEVLYNSFKALYNKG